MTHEQAENRLRTIIECVMPLINQNAEILKDVGLKQCGDTLAEVALQMQNCLTLIDRVREAKQA